MNQFNNIGSMFPGPENQALRENAKKNMTLMPGARICGLVIKNEHGDMVIVQQDKVEVFHADQVALVSTRVDPIQIAKIEYEYWKGVCDDKDPYDYAIEAMGAAANIMGALMRGLSAEEFRKEKEANESETTDNRS